MANGATIVGPSRQIPKTVVVLTRLTIRTKVPPNILGIVRNNGSSISFLYSSPIVGTVSFIKSSQTNGTVCRHTSTAKGQIRTGVKTGGRTIVLTSTGGGTALGSIMKTTFKTTKRHYVTLDATVFINSTRR